ncbi:hypothetical protein [Citricoccus sp.]|uniref:hypothetical protein n=1 Tax=Citricoccus sp. TaxID=1978372 RepID=UPI0028BE1A1A|nr:hypothetical protein [Citricoccus sp.]
MTITKITAPAQVTTSTEYGPVVLNFKDGQATHEGELSGGLRRYLEGKGYVVEAEAEEDLDDEAAFAAGLRVAGLQPEGQPVPAAPQGNASAEAWRAHAVARGLDEGTVADMSRDEVKAALANLDADQKQED